MPRLVQFLGSGAGREHPLAGEAVIGRALDIEVTIDDLGASRRHCRIRPEGAFWVAEDLGSRNGTFVNGARVDQVVPLRDGDSIRVGGSEFRFVAREGAADAGPRVPTPVPVPAAVSAARPGVVVPPPVVPSPAVARPPAAPPPAETPPPASPPPASQPPAPKKYDIQPKKRRGGW